MGRNHCSGCDVTPLLYSELVSNVAVGGEEGSSEDPDDAPSVSMSTTSTAYTLIETSHSVFGRVKRLWNSPTEEHREASARCTAGHKS